MPSQRSRVPEDMDASHIGVGVKPGIRQSPVPKDTEIVAIVLDLVNFRRATVNWTVVRPIWRIV